MPAVATGPYDTIEYVLNKTRVILNDSAQSLSGALFSDTQPYVGEYLNLGWRRLQRKLTNSGFELFIKEAFFLNVSPVPSVALDPATEVYISFTGFWDGSQMHNSPVLPVDMVGPLKMWERPSGQLANLMEMYPVNDGLPIRPQAIVMSQWDWRNDSIYMKGALQALDMKIRYNSYFPDLPTAPISFASTPVPILRSADALSCYVAAAFASARGSQAAGQILQMGDDYAAQMVEQTARKSQRGNHRRIPYSRRGNQGWGSW